MILVFFSVVLSVNASVSVSVSADNKAVENATPSVNNTNTQWVQATSVQTDLTSSGFRMQLSEFDPIKKETPKTADNQTTTKPQPGDWKGLIKSFLEKISNLFLLTIPIIASISLIIAGYFYIFSFANDEYVTKAKTIITYNFIAILVAFGSWVIISTLAGFFS